MYCNLNVRQPWKEWPLGPITHGAVLHYNYQPQNPHNDTPVLRSATYLWRFVLGSFYGLPLTSDNSWETRGHDLGPGRGFPTLYCSLNNNMLCQVRPTIVAISLLLEGLSPAF
ncbi:hypothetical protein Vafri_12793 [Volvox africanus]|uniref:Uncharacterized protein n=1 Tax=Volvox africanus TaxID=51714 RepID=A0A8J4BAY5_9CHLO|nr:hypothetical protein Vafri_12793 [Volvox africanus]